jgi:hypothetical protein
MLDREKVEAILIRRFPGAAPHQVAAAANAIMGLSVACGGTDRFGAGDANPADGDWMRAPVSEVHSNTEPDSGDEDG